MGFTVKVKHNYLSKINPDLTYDLGPKPHIFNNDEEAQLWAKFLNGNVRRLWEDASQQLGCADNTSLQPLGT